MNKRKSFLLGLVLLLAVLACLYFIFTNKTKEIVSDQDSTTQSEESQLIALSDDGKFEYFTGPYNCEISGFTETGEGILDTYTVQKGDSILSIANKIYNDSGKASDIVSLNKYRYNSMTTASSFLEVGWELLLPEPDISMVGEGFEIASGQVYILREGEIVIKTGSNSGTQNFYPNQITKELPPLKLGDCINIFEKDHSLVYKVELQ